MNIFNDFKRSLFRYPKLSSIGYKFIKRVWSIKSVFLDYDYPENTLLANITKEEVLEYNKNRDFGPKKRICYAPFNNLHFNINGDVSGCSFKKDYVIGNVNNASLSEIWFGDKINELRNSISNYNLEKCSSCKMVLDSGNYRSFPANKYDYFSSDSNTYPTQMSFEISNLCNLECLMCNEDLSSSIRKNRAKLPPLKYVYPKNFVTQLTEFIPFLSIATFIGGEPLLIKPYYDIWEEIIRLNPTCKIHTQINATYLPDKFLSMLNSGQFEIGISMEGCTKETYEAIRIKGNFETVEKNIEKLVELKKKGKVYLNINFCPLTLNWKEIPLMILYANQYNIALKLLNINNPVNLALKYRDGSYLSAIYQYLLNYKFNTENLSLTQSRNIESYHLFIKNIEFYIDEAEKRDLFFTAENNKTLLELKNIFEFEFINNNKVKYFSKQERKELSDYTYNYILSKTNNERLIKQIINRYRYIIMEVQSETYSEKNMEDSIKITTQLLDEYYTLEKEIVDYSAKTS